MNFYTISREPRPVRLSEATRSFAWDSLHHKYGLDTRKTMGVSLDHIEGIASMDALDQYDLAISEIAEKAPVRICENELLSGAASLGWAIYERVPATINGQPVCSGSSHLTIDFPSVLAYGCNGIRSRILESMQKHSDPCRLRFLKSALHCMDCFSVWHNRYLEKLKALPGYEKNYKNLCRVPFEPPRTFHEALQSIWSVFAFTRLCGNWPGIGRIDWMLGDFLKRDLEDKTLTLDEARELLAHFMIKGCEWICGDAEYGSGDAQHYQNLVLAGIDEHGREITNEVTYLILDVVEELGISDFPVTIRINANTSDMLLRRAAQTIRHGDGVVAFYNEELILKAMTDFGYPPAQARSFANDGCWEVQVPGKTNFSYVPFDSLAILQRITLKEYHEDCSFSSFEELYHQYADDLGREVEQICTNRIARDLEQICTDRRDPEQISSDCMDPNPAQISSDCTDPDSGQNDAPVSGWKWKTAVPCTVISLFEGGCIEKGLSYFEGGPVYTVCSPHIGGLPDTANSLYAIKKLVFDEKKLSFSDLMETLRHNWEGQEELRQYAAKQYLYYGNDNDEVDLLAARLLDDFAEKCRAQNGRCPILFPGGVSTFGRQLEWASHRFATPYGKKKGEVLAGNLSPTPGTDKTGATAIIKSYCKADLSRQTTGAALDIRLFPSDVRGEDGIAAITGLVRGMVALGGYFMQLSVADAGILLDAQKHPENYETLSVRVSGWNARFVTLNREWQDMIIQEVSKP